VIAPQRHDRHDVNIAKTSWRDLSAKGVANVLSGGLVRQSFKRTLRRCRHHVHNRRTWFAMVCISFLTASGCTSSPTAAPKLKVDPAKATEAAFARLDTNGNQQISQEEAAGCPALAGSMQRFDTDGSGQISTDEFEAELTRWVEELTRIVSVRCLVTLDGQPLEGATVKFVPVPFLADGTLPASGKTSVNGSASIGIEGKNLPDDFKRLKGVQLGLYQIEITHPQTMVPEKYNSATTLGCLVTRKTTDKPVVFNLKSR